MQLEGYALEPVAVDPGGVLDMVLYWRVLAPVAERLYGFVHLISPDGDLVAQHDHPVWGEAHPSSAWRVDELIGDRYHVQVPAEADPGAYLLSVGLYESETKARFVVRDGQGVELPGGQVTLASKPVIRWPARYEQPDVAHRTDARLGEVAELVGFDLQRDAGRLRVRLVWEAISTTSDSASRSRLKVFVHLRQGDTIVAQHDGEPGEGTRPTVAWRAGEFVEDVHLIEVEALPSGPYDLYVGMYEPETGRRLPARDEGGAPLANDEIPLGTHILGPAE
jgi:hypothetical protein